MRILIISQVFWPENFKINDMCANLVDRGHEVTVLTGKPNYPQGKFYQGYSFFSNTRERYNGINIIRVPIIPRGRGNAVRLSLNYLSFAVFGSVYSLFLKQKYDFCLVYGVSPILSALPAIVHRTIYKTKMFLWVQDLWPESVDVTGKLRNSFVRLVLLKLVKFIYCHSDEIYISSIYMKESILEKIGPYNKGKIHYLPNWAEDIFLSDNIDRQKYKSLMPDGFKVMFAGNISYGQDMPSIIKAASILKETSGIKFIVIGDGSERIYLTKKIKELGLENTISYLGSFPLSEMLNFYCHADMMLLTLRNEDIYALTVPSKLQGYLAASKPVAAMINGEAASIVDGAKCGFVVSAEDYVSLASKILEFSKKPSSVLKSAGFNGYNYYCSHFDKNKVIDFLLGRV